MKNYFDLQFIDLEKYLTDLSQPSYRAAQIWEGAYQHLNSSWHEITNLPKNLRGHLEDSFSLNSLELVAKTTSTDGLSTKLLFKLPNNNFIESVILRSRERITLCISTQSGCPVGCVFCATGRLGFFRDLTSGEIIEQVIQLMRLLNENDEHISNIVLMGMGEPFLNYDATLAAVKRFNDKIGLNIGARRITISTIGIPDKIIQFGQEKSQINLAVSLHAANDSLRQKLVPLARKIKVVDIINACKHYLDETHRRITFEYVMVDGLNDQPQHALELSELLQGLLCHVNLIGLNQTNHYSGKTPQSRVMADFSYFLNSHNIPASIRNSQGTDIQAACGQLAGKILNNH